MERKSYDNLESVVSVLGGENGPVYAGIIGIVLLVGCRYGYRFKGIFNNIDISVEQKHEDVSDTDDSE